MPCRLPLLAVCLSALIALIVSHPASAIDLVRDGKPVATIVVAAPPPAPAAPADAGKGKAKRKVDREAKEAAGDEALAVRFLVDWVKKMSDAELPVAGKAPADAPAIYVGRAAIAAGLKLDDIASPSREGVRIVIEPNRILLAGQSEAATAKAAARLLEQLGCRWFMEGPLGEVYPRQKTVSLEPQTITEKPGLVYRNPKGPSWSAKEWKLWNGAGGEPYTHSHAWAGDIPKTLFAQHPEYFAMTKEGVRKNGDWLCTSNPELRKFFAQQLIARVKAGATHPSISPPDGRGYCQCPKCLAQDDPKSVEPSSGTVSVSSRYADFFDEVARIVGKECPEARLSFYVYADYTQPPTNDKKLSENLVAVIAPIRYCRLHEIGHADCPSRVQQLEMTEGWARRASHLGYYNYMYNLADATLPMFKFTACKEEYPYLAKHGLEFMTIEVLSNWHIYGPQIFLSLRMAYDPKADATAIMDDYFTKFYGPAAAPMKKYWMAIDEATEHLSSHAGGFYGLAEIYTPERLKELQGYLDAAAEAAKGNGGVAARVAMANAGLASAHDYQKICALQGRGDFVGARQTFEGLIKRLDGLAAAHQANPEYATSYLERFFRRAITAGEMLTASPRKVVTTLPDRWKFAVDKADEGLTKNFATPEFDDSAWKEVATWSGTVNGQGHDENNVLWYRTKFTAPKTGGKLALAFLEVDGAADVFVNGKRLSPHGLLPAPPPKPVNEKRAAKKAAEAAAAKPAAPIVKPAAAPATPAPAATAAVPAAAEPNVDGAPEPKPAPAAAPAAGVVIPPPFPRRVPFEVDLAGVVKEGENVVAVRIDNRKISELFLGGILRPVVLVEKQ